MKRWLIVLGRAGTVLVAVGLALLLVSLIPPAVRTSFSSGNFVNPNTFGLLEPGRGPFVNMNFTFFSHFFSTLTPQQELKVELVCNGTLDVYILKIDLKDFMDNFHDSDQSVTLLEEFLQANPNVIGWQGEILEGVVDYIPTEVINATMILSNPSSTRIHFEFKGNILNLFAPTEKVRTLAIWMIPLGLVLALPWLLDLRKSKKI